MREPAQSSQHVSGVDGAGVPDPPSRLPFFTVSLMTVPPWGDEISVSRHTDTSEPRGRTAMTEIYLPVLLGTARPERRSETVACHVLDVIKQRGVRSDLIDVADYGLTGTGQPAHGLSLDAYRHRMNEADGLIVVAPEYNHGYPGELKLLLDSEYDAYVRKPVGFVSVSSGLIGGARVTEQLRLVTTALRMVPVSPAVHVTEVADAMDDQGRFSSDSLRGVLDDMLDELSWYANALANVRLG